MSNFTLDTIERTVRTIVQTSAAAILAYLTGIIGEGGWDAIEWGTVWKTGAGAGLLALLTALAAKPVGDAGSASFLGDGPAS